MVPSHARSTSPPFCSKTISSILGRLIRVAPASKNTFLHDHGRNRGVKSLDHRMIQACSFMPRYGDLLVAGTVYCLLISYYHINVHVGVCVRVCVPACVVLDFTFIFMPYRIDNFSLLALCSRYGEVPS